MPKTESGIEPQCLDKSVGLHFVIIREWSNVFVVSALQ